MYPPKNTNNSPPSSSPQNGLFLGTGGKPCPIIISTAMVITRLLFPAFSISSYFLTYFFFHWEKIVFATHRKLVGQRFLGPTHHGDSPWRILTNKGFHESLTESPEVTRGYSLFFSPCTALPSLCKFMIPRITWLPDSRN